MSCIDAGYVPLKWNLALPRRPPFWDALTRGSAYGLEGTPAKYSNTTFDGRSSEGSAVVRPGHLEPQVQPLLDLLSGRLTATRILQLRCGMPLLLQHLYRQGFTALFGTEDSRAQMGIVQAAREFCRVTATPVTIFDVRTAERADYLGLLEAQQRFDVVACFGVPNVLFFPLVHDLLAPGGVFICESHFREVPREFAHHFRALESHPVLGGRMRENFRAGGAVCVFVKVA